MKNLFLIVFALFFQQHLFAQKDIKGNYKYKAIYQLTYQPDSTNTALSLSEPMVLFMGENLSRFSSLGKAVSDSIKANEKNERKSMAAFQRLNAKLPKSEFRYDIFKLKKEGKIYFSEKIVKDNLIYEENTPLMVWKIESESKEILGYNTQKATTQFAGRKYNAWFTSEIPLTDGPYKFSGLPGLILEISDDQNYYVFKLTSFQKLKSVISADFNTENLMLVEKKEFNAIKKEYNLNPLAALESVGIKIHFTPAQEKEAKMEFREKFEKNNNPIELE